MNLEKYQLNPSPLNPKNVNNEFADFRKAFGGNHFRLVSPHNEEPMIKNACHENVAKIQMERGGKSVLGFSIARTINDDIFMISHSVWENPEGFLVDVTYKPNVFLPVKYFDASKEFYFTNLSCQFPKDPRNRKEKRRNPVNAIITDFLPKYPERIMSRDWLDSSLPKDLIFHRNYPRYEDEGYQEYLKEYCEDEINQDSPLQTYRRSLNNE